MHIENLIERGVIMELSIIINIAVFLVSAVIFTFVGIAIRKKIAESKVGSAENEAKRIIELAQKEAENKRKEEIFKAKEEIINARKELDKEVRERRGEVQQQERRLLQKEENLENKRSSDRPERPQSAPHGSKPVHRQRHGCRHSCWIARTQPTVDHAGYLHPRV